MADEGTTEDYDFFRADDDPTIPGAADGTPERRAIAGVFGAIVEIGRAGLAAARTFDELSPSERGFFAARMSVALAETIRDMKDLRQFLGNDALVLIQRHTKESP